MAKKAVRKARRNGMIKYQTYLWNDADPIIGIVDHVRRFRGISEQEIHEASDVSRSTLRNWRIGKTRRPKFETIAATAAALGVDSLPITSEARRRFRDDLKKTT